MYQCHAVGGVAARAHTGLGDATAVHLYPGGVGTHLALEESLLHLWNQLGRPDYHATDGDELVDVCGGRERSVCPLATVHSPSRHGIAQSWICQGRSGSAVKPRKTLSGGTEVPGTGWGHR